MLLNRRVLFWILPALLLFSIEEMAVAQQYIQLTKQSNGRIRYFYTGNRVRYRLKNPSSPKIERGRIQVITDSSIWVNNQHIPIDSLSYIGEGRLGVRIALGVASTAAGVFLITHIGKGNSYGFLQFLAGQALIGVGTLEMAINSVKLFTTTRYDLERKWDIEIRRFKNEPEE